jgi:hypothetical protein
MLAMPLLGALCVGCANVDPEPPLATPDRNVFDSQVWPILVRDCGFGACHGSEPRFFRVVGPGHERLDMTTRITDPATDAELQFSYDRARSMLNADEPSQSTLLRKPLEVAAGGSGHAGTDSFGRNVYRNAGDPNFQVLVHWAAGVAP